MYEDTSAEPTGKRALRNQFENRDEVPEEAPLAAACGRLGALTSEIDEALRILFDKIGPVIGPNYDEGKTQAGSPPERPSSAITSVINQNCNRLEEMVMTIHQIRRQVEL